MAFKELILNNIYQQYFFLTLVLLVLILAELFPWIGALEGPFSIELKVKYIAVAVIFFSSGHSSNINNFFTLTSVKIHAFIQVFNFLLAPFITHLVILLSQVFFNLDSWITKGIIAVSCMPPPVASAVILTKVARGNETISIINSALGSLLGLFMTPLLLLFHVGQSCTLSVRGTLMNLLGMVVLPFFTGQLAQKITTPPIFTTITGWLPQGALLLVLFTSFCEMFLQTELTVLAHEVLVTISMVVILQLLLMYISFRMVTLFVKKKAINREDIVPMIFCSSYKSITIGLPLLKTLYGGYSHLSQISLPLLILHPVQLILGALIVPFATYWISYVA